MDIDKIIDRATTYTTKAMLHAESAKLAPQAASGDQVKHRQRQRMTQMSVSVTQKMTHAANSPRAADLLSSAEVGQQQAVVSMMLRRQGRAHLDQQTCLISQAQATSTRAHHKLQDQASNRAALER